MPIHGYPGNVITANPTAPTVTSASGVWTTEQQLQAIAAGNWPGYEYPISRSLRFNSADSAYLNRTPGSAGNRRTFTWSGWVKRSALGEANLFSADSATGTTGYLAFSFNSTDNLQLQIRESGANRFVTTSAVYRDVSSWYHVVIAVDTTQATAANRRKMYVNGVEITSFGTSNDITQNFDTSVNNTVVHQIGVARTSGSGYEAYQNGYLTEVNFIDGQALTPSSFGLNDPETGVWSPKQYTGTYGTNGFYLNFSDNSGTTSTTLGKDSSGNGNNWTPNNFSVTAGAGNDSMVDTPTAYGTDTGVGGEVRGNYSTLNPLFVNNTYPITYSNGNLNATRAGGGQGGITNTIGMSSGKWYWEVVYSTYAYNFGITTNPAGSLTGSEGAAGYNGGGGTSIGLQPNGVLRTNGTAGSTYTSWTTGDVMGIALDMDGGNLYFYKNGTAMNSGSPVATSLTGSTWFFITSAESGASLVANFGQRAFAYTAPSGFKALCTQNLPTPTIGATSTTQANDYFNVVLWTGNSSTQTVTGVGFQPDLVWAKKRSGAERHVWFDAVRGAGYQLSSDLTAAETYLSNTLTSFTSDGFSNGNNGYTNESPFTYVAWNWKANGAGSSNTAGTITSTVSANTTSGFSIVTYTGTGSNATVGHGLGVAPSFIITKHRNAADGWYCYHASLGNNAYIQLSSTAARVTPASTYWQTTTPSSTVFSIGTSNSVNQNTINFVAYCFAPVAGYSAFGSYTGNGSADGPFVFTNFRPAFVMAKRTDSTENWLITDSARNTSNVVTNRLYANLSAAEDTGTPVDFLSNGFKIRAGAATPNISGGTYIYMAFAENPFKYSLAR